MSCESTHELDVLLEKLCEQQLNEAERARLEAMLRRDEACRKRYVNYADLHATLWILRGEPVLARGQSTLQPDNRVAPAKSPPLGPVVTEEKVSMVDGDRVQANSVDQGGHLSTLGIISGVYEDLLQYIRSPLALSLLAAAFVLGGAVVMVWKSGGGPEARNFVAQGNLPSVPVAYLTQANGCNWGGASPDVWTVGRSVQAGDEITLHEGIAEFRLSNGVSLSIEGPTALVMASPSSLMIQHGRLTAYVPWALTDFKLITAACQITGCDAEFGVYASGNEVDIHAFSGEVSAIPPFEQHPEIAVLRREKDVASGSDFSGTAIAAGRGLAVVNHGESIKVSRWHVADKDEFATKLTMGGALPITKKYVESVTASKPIAYWRFESNEGGSVVNEIEGQPDLKVVGNLRLIGDATNNVAELGRPGSDGFFLSQDTLRQSPSTDYSAEFWIKPSHVHTGGALVLIADMTAARNDSCALYVQMLGRQKDRSFSQKYPQAIRFLHRNPPGGDSTTGTSCFSNHPYTLRRWQHVVAVKNDELMSLFVDGELVASGRDRTSLASNLHVLVGQGGVSHRVNPFIGQFDELAIYDRAIPQQEIQEHLKSIDWKPEAKSTVRRKDS